MLKKSFGERCPARVRVGYTPEITTLQGFGGPTLTLLGSSPDIEAACLPQPGSQDRRSGTDNMVLEGPTYLPPAEFPRGPKLHVLSKGSERRLPTVLGDVGVEAGEQGSDGMPRSARMVEPAKEGKGSTSHSEAH